MDQPAPLFSILIGRVSTEDGGRILETLASLRDQDAGLTREVVVVDRIDDAVSATIRSRFPEVRLHACDRSTTLPEMRAQALAESRGQLILVTEDHCVPQSSWLRDFKTVLEEHPSASVIAGCVENGVTDRALDWATYLCEYASFAPPIEEGFGATLAGMNVLYKRSVLEECAPELLTKGFWETTVHPVLALQGKELLATNRVRIVHCKRFSFRLFAAQRFAYSRYYAGIRFAREQRLLRWTAALATPALPVLLTVRLVRTAAHKASIATVTLRAMPYMFAFFVIWAFGEMVGYLSGPGESLRTIE
ncbi:MAG: glycosyltransferase [Betaproteobacteria bacterium]